MTLAATAPVSDNHTAIWVVLALLTVFAIVAVLWQHERVSDRQGAEIAWLRYQMRHLLKHLNLDIPKPVEDDSPEAMAAEEGLPPGQIAGSPCTGTDRLAPPGVVESYPDDATTDEFPAIPATEPMAVVDPTPAVQARRDAAWDKQRPSPVPRGKSAEWVEDAIKGFDYSGRKR